LSAPVPLKKNRVVWLTQQNVTGSHETIPFDYRGSLSSIKNGCQIFIDDGSIALSVIGRTNNRLKAKVIVGGVLKGRKGVNIPQARLEFGGISHKDVQDIAFCEGHGVEYIAQSFVRSGNDVLDVKKLLKEIQHAR
jgi:pyruvate kinase